MDFKAPGELWNPLSMAVPDKFDESGRNSKQNYLQDRANFHRSLAGKIVLIHNTGICTYDATFKCVCLCVNEFHTRMPSSYNSYHCGQHFNISWILRSDSCQTTLLLNHGKDMMVINMSYLCNGNSRALLPWKQRIVWGLNHFQYCLKITK